MIKVLIASNKSAIRESLKSLISRKSKDIEVIGEAASGKDIIKLAEANLADVYILDISMPELNGIEISGKIKQIDPRNKSIILDIRDDRFFVERIFKSGVDGYCLKEDIGEDLVDAVYTVYDGKNFVTRRLAKIIEKKLIERKHYVRGPMDKVPLSAREKEVLRLIADGFSDKEVSIQLNIESNTAHVHRKNIMKKLDLHKQADLIRYAIKAGISEL